MSRYHLSTGGKRIRARLPLILAEALLPGDPAALENARMVGEAVEYLHNATLVHDDLQDGDTHRRGQPAVWKKYSAAQAINCGDGLFFFGMDAVSRINASDAVRFQIHQDLTHAILQVVEGQATEFRLKEANEPGVLPYLKVARAKTGALLAAPVLASLRFLQPKANLNSELLCRWGELFQVQDDLIDLWGAKGRDQNGTDILEGKVSFPVAWVYEHGSRADRDSLSHLLALPREMKDRSHIELAMNVFDRNQVLDAGRKFLHQTRSELIQEFRNLGQPALESALTEIQESVLIPAKKLDFLVDQTISPC